MPFWGRLVLLAAGIGVAAIDGLEPSVGVPDFIGGALILVAVFSLRRQRHVQDWRP